MRPGDHISQDDIAEKLGMSKLPIREALLSMSAEGLVDLKARRGAFVASMDRDDIADQFEAYGLVHGLAASRAAGVVSEAAIERLTNLNRQLKEAATPDQKRAVDWEFHRTINTIAASNRLIAFLKALSRFARSLPYTIWEEGDARTSISVRQHADIIAALAGNDSGAVERLCREHMKAEGDALIGVMERHEFWS
jgi:DNA-binding GntR family transcriptional regulator